MKLFADVNLFIDILERRAGWQSSFEVVAGVLEDINQGYISALIATLIYVIRPRVLAKNR